jgi:glucokinase
MVKFIGVDLGGTHVRAAVIDAKTGGLLSHKQVQTISHEGPDAVIDRMAELIEDVIQASGASKPEIGGIGIGAPGMIDMQRGMVLFLTNFPGHWPNIPLRQKIEDRVGLPTHLLNDARAMTFGEWKFGAGRGVNSMACFTLGTGIGGGLVIDGRLHLGLGGASGELGHQTVEIGGLLCGCGNRGCLEAYSSGPAIAGMGIKAVVQGLTTRIGEMVDYDLNRITPEVVFRAALSGDVVAREIYERAGRYLGVVISNVVVAVGPNKIVIGGGVSQAGELLLEPIRHTLFENVHIVPVSQVEIVLAELGINAGLIGAALWAKERLQETLERS